MPNPKDTKPFHKNNIHNPPLMLKKLAIICREVKPGDILRKPIEQNQFIKAVNDRVSSNSLLVEASCGFFTLLLAISLAYSFI